MYGTYPQSDTRLARDRELARCREPTGGGERRIERGANRKEDSIIQGNAPEEDKSDNRGKKSDDRGDDCLQDDEGDGSAQDERNSANKGKSEQSTRMDKITNMCRYDTEATMKASVSEALCARGEAAQSVIMAELQ
jgi:hypothetical protein